MSEVLRLEYNASTQSFVLVLDAVREIVVDGVVRMGVVETAARPTTRLTLQEIAETDPGLAVDLDRCIAMLEPIARAKANGEVESPEALRHQAAKIAREREALEQAKAEVADLDSQIAKKRAALAAANAATEEK